MNLITFLTAFWLALVLAVMTELLERRADTKLDPVVNRWEEK